MSLEIIDSQVTQFLARDTPEILAIKGEWGVGKTYTWDQILLRASQEGSISKRKYSYVSLFGMSSLEGFKYSIFESSIECSVIGKRITLDTLKENTKALSSSLGKRSLKFFQNAPVLKGFGGSMNSLAFLSLSDTLICIDDLERMGDGLKLGDILGLAHYLKEKRNCKVVFLLNESEIGSEYKTYREKVVDIELKFDPTVEESTNIAFTGTGQIYDELRSSSRKLKIKNIRVLKKIELIVNNSTPYLIGFEPEVTSELIHTATVLSWCFYSSSESVPAFDYVITRGYGYLGIGEDTRDEEHKRWDSLLSDYDFSFHSDFDSVIADSVSTGYVNEQRFSKAARELNKRVLADKSEKSVRHIWNLYHHSFEGNQAEIVDSIKSNVESNSKHISPSEISGRRKLLKSLNLCEIAAEIIKLYLEKRKDDLSEFKANSDLFWHSPPDSDFHEALNNAYQLLDSAESVEEILRRIAKNNSWNPEDEMVLAKTAPSEYLNLFMSIQGDELPNIIRRCLEFGKFVNASELQIAISDNVRSALKEISDQNILNKIRVKKFVNFDSE